MPICPENYAEGPSNTCIKCITSACMSCPVANFKCTQCAIRTYNRPGSDPGTDCVTCPNNCIGCSVALRCDACKTNFYLTKATDLNFVDTCTQCPDGCSGCTLGTTGPICSTCYPGYRFDATNKRCIACSSTLGCVACNELICSSCNPGYFLDQGICKPCAFTSACKTCISATDCSACFSGYLLSSTFACGACVNNCDSCGSSTTCTACSKGYFKVTENGVDSCRSCSFATSSCAACTSDSDCTECGIVDELKYYLITKVGTTSSSCRQACPAGYVKNEQMSRCDKNVDVIKGVGVAGNARLFSTLSIALLAMISLIN